MKGYNYTSNEVKLFKHLDKLIKFQYDKPSPVMFHISPTNACNMNCTHCCFSNRDQELEIEPKDLIKALDQMAEIGVKSVEWTGGGEPTLYGALPYVTEHAKKLWFDVGMITNAMSYRLDLDYSLFSWVRVSMNVFDEGGEHYKRWETNVKKIHQDTKVTACYVASNYYTPETLEKIVTFAEENKIYTRIAPDCMQSLDGIERLLDKLKEEPALKASEYVFLSDFNIFLGERKDDYCAMHAIKPFLFTDGYVYPCPSMELALEHKGNVNKDFRLTHMNNIRDYYWDKFETKTHTCSYCKYTNQNNILNAIKQEVEDDKFC